MSHQKNIKQYRKTAVYMDTYITIEVVTDKPEETVSTGLQKAFSVFEHVEKVCSRFDRESELRRLSLQIGKSVPVSELLFQALFFSVEMARLTDGVFNPAIGQSLEQAGFNKNYLTGERTSSKLKTAGVLSYEAIGLNKEERTVTLKEPLLLDLGGAAKGLAADLAGRELEGFEGYVIDAGGDLLARGTNEGGQPWKIGIQHPERKTDIIGTLKVMNASVCTSGSYERRSKSGIHHLIHPKTQRAADEVVSCTAVGPYAMLADAFSTAAFLMGAEEGLSLLESHGLDGIMLTSSGEILKTEGLERYGYTECESK